MATVMVSIEGVRVKARGGKPRLLLRGRRRTSAIRAKAALKALRNQDWFENVRSSKAGYNPFLVLGAANSQYSRALGALESRLGDALAAKA